MSETAHKFDPTILREYDIRGVVGKTLHVADARAIGRTFGSMVRRNGGKRVALGYDGRFVIFDQGDALGLVKDIVKRVSFQIAPGEKLALVGESGSGKTLTAMSLLKLVPQAQVSGQAVLAGRGETAATDLMQRENLSHCFKLLHFHIGSQVPDILTVKPVGWSQAVPTPDEEPDVDNEGSIMLPPDTQKFLRRHLDQAADGVELDIPIASQSWPRKR
mgnify:CR=1 FL=1